MKPSTQDWQRARANDWRHFAAPIVYPAFARPWIHAFGCAVKRIVIHEMLQVASVAAMIIMSQCSSQDSNELVSVLF